MTKITERLGTTTIEPSGDKFTDLVNFIEREMNKRQKGIDLTIMLFDILKVSRSIDEYYKCGLPKT